MHICMYACVHVHVCCDHVCICTCVCLYVYACMCMHDCTCKSIVNVCGAINREQVNHQSGQASLKDLLDYVWMRESVK